MRTKWTSGKRAGAISRGMSLRSTLNPLSATVWGAVAAAIAEQIADSGGGCPGSTLRDWIVKAILRAGDRSTVWCGRVPG